MGKHLLLDLSCNNHKLMSDKEFIRNMLTDIARIVDMRTLIDPVVVSGADYNPGATGFVIIETSHISMHTFTARNKISFDLYSCTNFNVSKVITYVIERMNATILRSTAHIRRDA